MKRLTVLITMSLGLLASTACAARGYYVAGPPPPPPPRAYMGVAPGPHYVWTDGFWAWRSRWVWVPGRWVLPPRARAAWVPGYWRHHNHRYVWVEGRWR